MYVTVVFFNAFLSSSMTWTSFLTVFDCFLFLFLLQVSGLFRPYAMVKSVSLIRDPSSQFATHLGYIEFYSVEHAQYALQSYNHAHSGSTNEVHGGVSAAAFANVKAMQRLQKEVHSLFACHFFKVLLIICTCFCLSAGGSAW